MIKRVARIPSLIDVRLTNASMPLDRTMQANTHESTNTTYSGNGFDGNLIGFQGPIHGDVNLSIGDSHEDQKCLQDLYITDPHDDKGRIEETKGRLLQDSCRWVIENDDFCKWRDNPQCQVLWVKGDPGKGKTMLLCGVIDELEKATNGRDQVCYFFCQATDLRINNGTAILRGLLYLLVKKQPSLVAHIRKKNDNAGKALFTDANAWVALTGIFVRILRDPNLKSTYLIIDALDECVESDLHRLLAYVIYEFAAACLVEWIISSRNIPNIQEWLNAMDYKKILFLELNA